jgi:cytochrome d ubiquinol oxidase subunit I
VILSAYLTAGAFVVGVSFWQLHKHRADAAQNTAEDKEERSMYRSAVRTGAVLVLLSGLGVALTGDIQGKIMTEVQPMKMAAAEALYDTEQPASFSLLTIGPLDGSEESFAVKLPKLLSYLATGTFDGEVEGINDLREQYRETYGQDPGEKYYSPGDYTPIIPLTYWTFRLMIGFGLLAAAAAAWILWVTRKRARRAPGRSTLAIAVMLPFLPLLANSMGWIFTEMGRQPWAVFGLMTTDQAVSPGVSAGEMLTSLIVLTLLYGVLAFVEVRLMLTYISRGADQLPPERDPDDPDASGTDQPLAFAY